jgi:hypothetical protein
MTPTGYRPSATFSRERVPILIAPEVRDRLNALLYSQAFMGTGIGFSAFIDRACERAETEYAEQLTASSEGAALGRGETGGGASIVTLREVST